MTTRTKSIEKPSKIKGKTSFIYGTKQKEVNKTQNSSTYNSTILKQRIKYVITSNINTEDINSDLVYYIKRNTWSINRLSPIFNIDFQEVNLKRYAAKIKQALAKTVNELDNDLFISSKFTEMEPREAEKDNFKIIQIEVTYRRGESLPQLKYKGLIMNWGSYSEENVHKLPLLLCTGTENAKKTIHYTLQEMFNTYVSPIAINEDDMYWLFVLSGFSSTINNKLIKLFYNIPGHRDNIRVSLPVEILQNIWDSVRKEDFNVITIEEIMKFKTILNRELINLYDIRIDKLNLNKLILPVSTFYTSGKFKIHDADYIDKIITFIQNMSNIVSFININ